ncbi:diacylglycerol/lipid kinase family protein [Bifidobacterium canis]|uniref:DeoR family transcriptional regulator n=1 Tax=Bifidobacterium canis TaxID=2610880 RepID=A0A7K1J5Q4_9BIFI|nr:diacylglycerol kinase family protein [Bifidobacterium canis]MUH59977.1 DeoR family transcriptional regulator [Bifidobacterium canis]
MNNQWIIILACIVAAIIIVAGIAVGIRLHRRRKRVEQLENDRRNDTVHYAFVINPSKPTAKETRAFIEQFCADRGVTDITFIETQLDKDGRACALQALNEGADVVIAVGGDGTVRTVASAMGGTNHAMGIIPIGTGNLFARNMNIPVGDLEAAMLIALSHGSYKVDIGRLTLLDHPEDDHGHAFLIIAGIGFDALMIDDTDPQLKKNISWLAYFVAGAKHLFAPKYHASVEITDEGGQRHERNDIEFRTFMAGNCGEIPMFSLMPDASLNDGLLDFEVIDTNGGLLGWMNLFGDVVHQTITRKAQQSPLSVHSKIDQVQGLSAELRLQKAVPAQVDGDMLPPTKHIRFSVDHDALIVRAPGQDAEMTANLQPIKVDKNGKPQLS